MSLGLGLFVYVTRPPWILQLNAGGRRDRLGQRLSRCYHDGAPEKRQV